MGVTERVTTGLGGGRMRLGLVAGLLATIHLACAVPGFGPAAIPAEERSAYDAAIASVESDPLAAEAELRAFIEAYPGSGLFDDAAEQLANLAFRAGREEEGLRWLGRILSEAPASDRASPARLRLAQFEYARNKWPTARRLLEPLDLQRLSLPEQRAALRLAVVLAQTPVERLARLASLRGVLEAEIRERAADPAATQRLSEQLAVVDQEIREAVQRAAPAELEAVLRDLRGDPPSGLIQLELGRLALESGDFAAAAAHLDRARSRRLTEADLGVLEVLQERIARREALFDAEGDLPSLRQLLDRRAPRIAGARGKIGVVLPLSGEFAAFGEQSLRGLLVAAGLFGGSDSIRELDGIRLIVRDSAGRPATAAARVRELAEDPEIVAIVGPIFSAESLAAAEAAEQSEIPLISLSHREEIAAGRAHVFRTRTTPADEVSVLVDHAFDVLDARRFAVLYPRTRYGRGMRKLYWDAVLARGGKMVAVSAYGSEDTDFSSSIQDMIGYRFITDSERRALRERDEKLRGARRRPPEEAAELRKVAYSTPGPEGEPLPPIVDFDVLFIPDGVDKVSLIAPALAFHEIRGVALLGTSEWLDEELLRVARQHVSGSVISTSFYPESDLPFVSEFVEEFRATFGEEPDAYAAQAFDAANLVLMQLAQGREDRAAIRHGLLGVRAYPGATGVLTMRSDGNARRRPFLLGVKGQRFIPLD